MKKGVFTGAMAVMTYLSSVDALSGSSMKEMLFATPSWMGAKISPDGTKIASIGGDAHGVANLFISGSEGDGGDRTQLSFFDTPQIIQFFWSADSNHVLLLKEEAGSGNLQLYGFHLPSKEATLYTASFPNTRAKMVRMSTTQNGAVIGLNQRDPQFHDLYHLDLDSGCWELLFENQGYAKCLVSDQLELILKIKINEQDGSWSVFTSEEDLFMELSAQDAFQTEFLDYNNGTIYLLDNRFSDTNQLIAKTLLGTPSEQVLGAAQDSDVDEVLFIQGEPRAYASYYEEKTWHAIDSTIEPDLVFLTTRLGRNFEVVNTNQAGDLWMVVTSAPHQGVRFWLYHTTTQTLKRLGSDEKPSFAHMYPMVVPARDGQPLVCYYTLPQGVDKGGDVEQPIPLVVVPHGGPFKVRDRLSFNPYHQWLASCGYAVLSVNFRLSSGFGKAFVNAGNGQWGGKAHLDVIDAVEACVARGLTQRGKVAVLGASYGGYEALASLTFTPDDFVCAVAMCGPSDLKTVLDHVPSFWEFTPRPLADRTMFFTKSAFVISMGPNLQRCSPLHHLDAIQAPLLLVHGNNDHIVAQSESEQIYRSMTERNQEVIYILFPDEGHRLAQFANHMLYLDHAERFLSQHLGGIYNPVDPQILGRSSAQVFGQGALDIDQRAGDALLFEKRDHLDGDTVRVE